MARRSLSPTLLPLLLIGCSPTHTFQPRAFLMTAYAAPVLEARHVRSDTFASPIRALPTTPRPFPTRRALHASAPPISPSVLAWVADPLDAYLAEVNGSLRVRFPDGQSLCLAWIATNERPYTSLGQLLVEAGHASPDSINLARIRELHQDQPNLVEALMLENDRVVFFEAIPCEAWPRASTGAVLVPLVSLAVDPREIPLGSTVRLAGRWADGTPLELRTTAVDIGGAIKGTRIDLYLGAGDDAMRLAGAQRQTVLVTIEPTPSGCEESDGEIARQEKRQGAHEGDQPSSNEQQHDFKR